MNTKGRVYHGWQQNVPLKSAHLWFVQDKFSGCRQRLLNLPDHG